MLLTFVGYAIVLVSAHLITVVGGEPVYFVRLMGGLVMLIGSVLLGVMTLYARMLLIVSFPLDDILDLGVLTGSIVFAVVWGSLGYALFSRGHGSRATLTRELNFRGFPFYELG